MLRKNCFSKIDDNSNILRINHFYTFTLCINKYLNTLKGPYQLYAVLVGGEGQTDRQTGWLADQTEVQMYNIEMKTLPPSAQIRDFSYVHIF